MKYDLTNIMKKAWRLARQWAMRKGGKAIEYISFAMKRAWKIAKNDYKQEHGLQGLEGNEFTLQGSNNQPMYLAEVTGIHPKFGLDRNFVSAPEKGRIDHTFELEEKTVYNWKESREQYFGKFENGQMTPLTKEEAIKVFK